MEKLKDMIPDSKKHILLGLQKSMYDMMTGQKKCSSWKGYRFSPGFEPEVAQYEYESYSVDKDAVFGINYPKTGTNWTMEIVRNIMYGHDAELNTLVKSLPPFLAMMGLGKVEKYQLLEHIPVERRLFAGHTPEELVNFKKIKEKNGKVIIVLRNPKDQAVSLYYFTKDNPAFDSERDKFSREWSQFLSDYMQGKLPLFTKEGEWYPDHILGWYKHKDDPNILFLYYEDMKKDVKKEIRRIASFLDVDLSEDRVDEIAESTAFSKMKRDAEDRDTDIGSLRSKLNLMRKGQVGEWKQMFTVAQSEEMDRLIEEKLGNTDIKFTYTL